MRKAICYMSVLLLHLGLWHQVQAQDMNKLAKDIRILERILKASLGDDNDDHRRHGRHNIRPHDIGTSYLRGQGVVLLFEMGFGHEFSHLSHVGQYNFDLHVPPIPPIVIDPSLADDEEAREQYEEVVESYQEMIEEMAENAADAIEEATDALMEVESFSASREIAKEMRRMREEQRRAVHEIRRKSLETRRQLLKKKEFTPEEQAKLTAELEEYKTKIEASTKAYYEKAEAIRSAQTKEWDQEFGKFEKSLVEAICEYGASVRLPEGEHLTIILLRGGGPTAAGHDRIYVFKKADLQACRNGNFNAEELLKRSRPYTFE
ncbi:hypothetical protein SCOR_09345 [Sulfidibacter corallicola]|uniref:Uncharacterized protein n=1 Tax=Sulfidibacter corallicola TaxID=2818388 RepID=A0A8A4TNN2_SULCO|nr:hypothetical protein [Sulfidibacter corallicola]QTD51037.1 hypothetical protein J3U87_01090 [Sulfidibacter corallicola]